MEQDNFYITEVVEDEYGLSETRKIGLNTSLIEEIINKKYTISQELDALLHMLNLLRDELTSYANEGHQVLNNAEIGILIRAIRILLKRQNLKDLKLPFNNFSEFYDDWRSKGLTGTGSWSRRRMYVSSLLEYSISDVKEKLDAIIFDDLVYPVENYHQIENWDNIFNEINELRIRYTSARTAQDFSAVGVACVRIIEGLSRVAYIHSIHGDSSQEEPAVSKTDLRIGQVITFNLGGRPNEELRALAKTSSAVAHKVKHATTPNALQAGIACDSVILLCSIINRIEIDRIKSMTD